MSGRTVSLPHYAWAAGHIVVLAGTIYTLLGLVTFSARSKSYYLSYGGAILSWGIVVYKSLGAPQPNKAYIQRALLDENVQYLLLAFYWFFQVRLCQQASQKCVIGTERRFTFPRRMKANVAFKSGTGMALGLGSGSFADYEPPLESQKPIYVTLIPFATFSLFHTLTFVRTTVLPKPPSTPAAAPGAAKPTPPPATASTKASKQIQVWVKAHYEQAMLFVSYVEVVLVFGRVFLGAITFQNSLLAPLFFAHFLRLRYYLSPPTRQAFAWVSAQLDHGMAHPSCPPIVKKGVTVARDLVRTFKDSEPSWNSMLTLAHSRGRLFAIANPFYPTSITSLHYHSASSLSLQDHIAAQLMSQQQAHPPSPPDTIRSSSPGPAAPHVPLSREEKRSLIALTTQISEDEEEMREMELERERSHNRIIGGVEPASVRALRERERVNNIRRQSLGYSFSTPTRQAPDSNRSKPVGKRWLVLVVPPAVLPHSPPPTQVSGFASGYGASGRFSGGILLPLQSTVRNEIVSLDTTMNLIAQSLQLQAQLALIAREFSLPSLGGVNLYLCLPESGGAMSGLKPRLMDETWSMLWHGHFDSETQSSIEPLEGVGSLPIAARIEFDVDARKARWLPGWMSAAPSAVSPPFVGAGPLSANLGFRSHTQNQSTSSTASTSTNTTISQEPSPTIQVEREVRPAQTQTRPAPLRPLFARPISPLSSRKSPPPDLTAVSLRTNLRAWNTTPGNPNGRQDATVNVVPFTRAVEAEDRQSMRYWMAENHAKIAARTFNPVVAREVAESQAQVANEAKKFIERDWLTKIIPLSEISGTPTPGPQAKPKEFVEQSATTSHNRTVPREEYPRFHLYPALYPRFNLYPKVHLLDRPAAPSLPFLPLSHESKLSTQTVLAASVLAASALAAIDNALAATAPHPLVEAVTKDSSKLDDIQIIGLGLGATKLGFTPQPATATTSPSRSPPRPIVTKVEVSDRAFESEGKRDSLVLGLGMGRSGISWMDSPTTSVDTATTLVDTHEERGRPEKTRKNERELEVVGLGMGRSDLGWDGVAEEAHRNVSPKAARAVSQPAEVDTTLARTTRPGSIVLGLGLGASGISWMDSPTAPANPVQPPPSIATQPPPVLRRARSATIIQPKAPQPTGLRSQGTPPLGSLGILSETEVNEQHTSTFSPRNLDVSPSDTVAVVALAASATSIEAVDAQIPPESNEKDSDSHVQNTHPVSSSVDPLNVAKVHSLSNPTLPHTLSSPSTTLISSSTRHTQLQLPLRYPYFNLYPSSFPHLNIYPSLSASIILPLRTRRFSVQEQPPASISTIPDLSSPISEETITESTPKVFTFPKPPGAHSSAGIESTSQKIGVDAVVAEKQMPDEDFDTSTDALLDMYSPREILQSGPSGRRGSLPDGSLPGPAHMDLTRSSINSDEAERIEADYYAHEDDFEVEDDDSGDEMVSEDGRNEVRKSSSHTEGTPDQLLSPQLSLNTPSSPAHNYSSFFLPPPTSPSFQFASSGEPSPSPTLHAGMENAQYATYATSAGHPDDLPFILSSGLGLGDDSPLPESARYLEEDGEGSEDDQYLVLSPAPTPTSSAAPQPSPGVALDPHAPVLFSFPSPSESDDLTAALAQYVCEAQNQSLNRRGRFCVALSGGSLPKLLAEGLLNDEEIFFVDERLLPLDHVDSTFKAYNDALFSKVPVPAWQIHSVKSLPDLADEVLPAKAAEEIASDMETQLMGSFPDVNGPGLVPGPPRFDLILMGMGEDGHCASLFPGHALLDEKDWWVAYLNDSPKPPLSRITFTLPLLSAARRLAFVCAGAAKSEALANALDQGLSHNSSDKVPAGRVVLDGHPIVWFVDEAARGELDYPASSFWNEDNGEEAQS
ncbi:6-phosphogluconolactonase, partial [Phenoliferia sp. Uapishka_3]